MRPGLSACAEGKGPHRGGALAHTCSPFSGHTTHPHQLMCLLIERAAVCCSTHACTHTHTHTHACARKYKQEEVDRLTKRAKVGETAFLELYQKLYEAPDPAPALAVAFETAARE